MNDSDCRSTLQCLFTFSDVATIEAQCLFTFTHVEMLTNDDEFTWQCCFSLILLKMTEEVQKAKTLEVFTLGWTQILESRRKTGTGVIPLTSGLQRDIPLQDWTTGTPRRGLWKIRQKFHKKCGFVYFPRRGCVVIPLIGLLTRLFLMIYHDRIILDKWFIAKIMPIHKNGSRHLIKNYQPLAGLCCTSKILKYSS